MGMREIHSSQPRLGKTKVKAVKIALPKYTYNGIYLSGRYELFPGHSANIMNKFSQFFIPWILYVIFSMQPAVQSKIADS
jgi:hypothetical protein